MSVAKLQIKHTSLITLVVITIALFTGPLRGVTSQMTLRALLAHRDHRIVMLMGTFVGGELPSLFPRITKKGQRSEEITFLSGWNDQFNATTVLYNITDQVPVKR